MKRVTKSVTALLLALVLSLTLLPAQALAADTAPATQTYTGTVYVGAHTNPVYARVWKGVAETSLQTAPSAQTAVAAQAVDYLTETEAVAALRKQMVARKETMTLNVKLPSGTDIEEAVTGIWDKAMEHVSGSGTTGDYLRWQHSGYDCPPVDYWDDDTNITFTVTFQRHPKTSAIWFTTAAQEAALTNYIRNTILPQLSLGGKTTYQKVQAIYNWITANVKYDYSHLNDPAYRLQYTAYAAAVQKKAVCQGYANLFYRLANDAGIDCRIITGKAYNGTQTEDHAWNIVRMEDEKYYCLDATWDAGLKPENYEYFLKGLTSFSRDHQAETDKLNTPYWTQYESRTSAADYKASSPQLPAPTVTGGNDSQGRPTLKWNAVIGAAKYEVYRARSLNGDYIKYSTVTGTSYTNISYIENGNTYYYKVRALKSDGTAGAWSSIVSVTYRAASTGTLPAPTVTGGNDSQGRPTLKWNAVSGAAKYEVYRARSKDGDYIKYSTVTGTSYTNTSYIENGNTYCYKVRALKSDGTAGAWSSIVSVTYKQTLSAPAVTGGNDSQGRPTLKWNAVTGAAKYEVYRARSKDGDYIKYSTVTGTSYTNTSYIENGNTYYYKVRALDANGTAGAWSSIVSVTYRAASTGTLSAPTVTGGNDAQGRPTLKWNAVTGAAKYEVYRARSLNGDYIKYSTVTGTSYTNTSYIENGNTYYYKVRALDASGTAGAWSSIVSVTYRAASTGTLSAPTVTGGNDSQGRPTLKWNAVTGAAKYEVYRARSKDGTYTKYSTTTGTAYTNSSYLTSGATYYYKVRALDANGNAGPYSAVVSVTCRLKLTAPTVTGSTDSQGRPTLKWNAVTGAAKYEVYRARSKDGDYIKYSTVTGTSYTNTSYLANGTTYYYKVRALGSDGTAGPDSTPVSVTYKAPFGAPLVTGSKDSQGRPALKWDKVTDAAKYEVYRARSKNGTYSLMSTQSATGYTNTSYLANGTTYYYKVRALKASGTASAYSSVVTITYGTVPTPAAPAMRSAKADSAGITVSWDTAANAVTYNVYRTADAGSSWTQVASSVKGTSYKDTTVQKGVKYGYKVRGVAADGKTLGPMSSTGVTAKVTAASTTPDYVKLKSAKSDPGNGILLTWESAADAKTYNVYRKVDGASGWTLLASSVSGTSYRDTSGKRGTTYVYTVRGVAADGKTLSRTYNTDGLRATVR
ncbi:MAG: transglutaminase domain-containing protein [Oscillospiraceae bacterium]